jgi:hypothetical protein
VNKKSRKEKSDHLNLGLQEFFNASNGLVKVEWWTPEDVAGLLTLALSGDGEAARRLRAVSSALKQARERSLNKDPLLCGACDHAFDCAPPDMVCLIWPAAAVGKGTAISFLFCGHCAEDMQGSALTAVKALMPDARQVHLHEAGRA